MKSSQTPLKLQNADQETHVELLLITREKSLDFLGPSDDFSLWPLLSVQNDGMVQAMILSK